MLSLAELSQMRGDEPAMRRWTEEAADAGHGPALLAAGQAAISNDPEAAARWLTTLAERGNPQAASSLAELYRGQGDADAAERWAEQARKFAAALEDHRAGQAALDRGDPDETERLWRRAAEAGFIDAIAGLGDLLARRNVPDAEHWLHIAANHGVPRCADLLAQYRAHHGDQDQARAWRKRAPELARGL